MATMHDNRVSELEELDSLTGAIVFAFAPASKRKTHTSGGSQLDASNEKVHPHIKGIRTALDELHKNMRALGKILGHDDHGNLEPLVAAAEQLVLAHDRAHLHAHGGER